GGANLSDRVPILTEGFRFSGSEKRKIRLVIRVDARHQFDVRAVFIREVAIPRVTKRVVAPSPLFLPWRDVMIGHQNQSSFMLVIVARVEVFARANCHVTGGDRDIRVPTQVVGGVAARRNELRRLLFGGHALSTAFAVIHTVVVTVAEGKTT